MQKQNNTPAKPSTVFKVGAISLAFLIIGYEAALFIHRAAVLRIEADRDRPDTVYVMDESLARKILSEESGGRLPAIESLPDGDRLSAGDIPAPRMQPGKMPDEKTSQQTQGNGPASGTPETRHIEIRRDAPHSPAVKRIREQTRRCESFRFNPNTVSLEELQRLGFSIKQAEAIDKYRKAGGRFNRKEDFGKSFVVSDSTFRRLSPYIDIPKLDINLADSAAFDALPGIGPYFASRMVEYRGRLGGYSYPEQLMDIYRFDREKFDALSDLITCSLPENAFGLWTLDAESLAAHPYIRNLRTARAIILYRENTQNPSVEGLEAAGVLPYEDAERLSRCKIGDP